MINLLLVALGIVLNVSAQVALKLAAMALVPAAADGKPGVLSLATILADPLRVVFQPWFMLGLVLYAVSVVNWLVVLSRMELSVSYPLMSLALILTLVVGVTWFKEPLTPVRVVGVLVIILGAFLVTRPAPVPA